jgi:hypothetical protein
MVTLVPKINGESLGAGSAASVSLALVPAAGSSQRAEAPILEPLVDLLSDPLMQITSTQHSVNSAAEMGLMDLIVDIQAMDKGLGDGFGPVELGLEST